jgi:DNA-binding transcriptional regulator GbsR (MarR family)
MSFVTALAQVLVSLPKLFEFIQTFVSWVEKQFGPDWPKVIADMNETFKKLEQAKNVEERVDAARELQKILTKL